MTRTWRTLFLATQLAALLVVPAVQAQESIKELKDPAFAAHRRSPAVFDHDGHNEKAGLADCAACHHGGKNGVMDKSATSEGTPCAECHPARAVEKGVTPLERAWHRQCIGCHRQTGKGPLACGQCHRPS